MLPLKDYSQNSCYSLLRCTFIHHLMETWLIRQIVNFLVDCLNAFPIQLVLSSQYGIRVRREQDVIIQRRYEASTPSIKELQWKINATASAITNNIRIITIEDGKSGDACYRLHPQK